MGTLFLIIYVLCGLVSVVCWFIVLIDMFIEGDWILALVFILCCQIGVFFYGWISYNGRKGGNGVMTIWTVAVVVQLLIEVLTNQGFLLSGASGRFG